MNDPKRHSDPMPTRDPMPQGDPKPYSDPKPAGDPNPTGPEQEIGDRPGNAGQHPATPPEVDAKKHPSAKNSQSSPNFPPLKQPINDRNTAGDRGAREPASR
jgi:hypothetical protein